MKLLITSLLLVMTGCGAESRPAQPRIILKLDDAWAEGDGVHPGWRETFDYLNERCIVGTIGVIGGRNTEPSPAYYGWLKAQARQGHELWNHGWCHCKEDGDVPEFRGNDYAYQYEHLRQTQDLIRRETGITMCTFGAPYNAVDSTTAEALAAIHDLKIWLYPKQGLETAKTVFPRISAVNIEYPVHQPDFEQFRAGYLANLDEQVLTIQGHPRSWMTDGRMDEFRKIIEFLHERKTVFTTPARYAEELNSQDPPSQPSSRGRDSKNAERFIRLVP